MYLYRYMWSKAVQILIFLIFSEMRSFFLFLPLLVMVKRSEGDVCADVAKEFYECTMAWVLIIFLIIETIIFRKKHHHCNYLRYQYFVLRAHQTFVEEMKLGDDGKPDFRWWLFIWWSWFWLCTIPPHPPIRTRKTCTYMKNVIEV